MLKEHPTPQTSAPIATPVADWDIPQSFYDLLDKLESSELEVTDASQPSSNKASQSTGTKVTSCETKHRSINTDPKKTADKGTNIDPLIILAPKDIQDPINGFKLISFEIPEVFIQTTNSLITPKPKFEPKYVLTVISDKTRTEKEVRSKVKI